MCYIIIVRLPNGGKQKPVHAYHLIHSPSSFVTKPKLGKFFGLPFFNTSVMKTRMTMRTEPQVALAGKKPNFTVQYDTSYSTSLRCPWGHMQSNIWSFLSVFSSFQRKLQKTERSNIFSSRSHVPLLRRCSFVA